jgi:uncharacterized membrane protein YdjX (TVP38/TMEM64 family)
MPQFQLLQRVLMVLLGFVILYAVMVLLLRSVGLENAQQWIQRAGNWAPLIFIGLCAGSLIIAPLSGSSLFIAGGAVFGKETGYVLSLIASILGCSINFWISRKLGRSVVSHLIGRSNLKELDKFTGRLKGNRGVFYLVLIMPLSQDIVSYAAGLTPISYSRFLIALILSGAVIIAAYIYLGTSLLEVFL